MFHERMSMLDFVANGTPREELADEARLEDIFRNMKRNHPDLVDLGLIDTGGRQVSYVGPYDLRDKDYSKQAWFVQVMAQERAVSRVFLGYREFPHLAIAVLATSAEGEALILRATLNSEVLPTWWSGEEPGLGPDAFIVDHDGILQTPSKLFGPILSETGLRVSAPVEGTQVVEENDDEGGVRIKGYGYVDGTPFVFMVVEQRKTLLTNWLALRDRLLLFLVVSMLVIVAVILAGATGLVNKIRDADRQRLTMLHKIEYTAKMASIGRLAAGVAHEINNPLAIINQKAGLLMDILTVTDDFPRKEKFIATVEPILYSVDRCAKITRRLLGFAKHGDVRTEEIDLDVLVREVLGFIEKECMQRNIEVRVDAQQRVPKIMSDKGRLQQIFLNLINNAIAAVEDAGGRIHVLIAREGDDRVSVTVGDNGTGIRQEDMAYIFEPFFTTKKQHGTGLGLSITYGLVSKLGGKISVESEVGQGTRFTVVLPVQAAERGAESERDRDVGKG